MRGMNVEGKQTQEVSQRRMEKSKEKKTKE